MGCGSSTQDKSQQNSQNQSPLKIKWKSRVKNLTPSQCQLLEDYLKKEGLTNLQFIGESNQGLVLIAFYDKQKEYVALKINRFNQSDYDNSKIDSQKISSINKSQYILQVYQCLTYDTYFFIVLVEELGNLSLDKEIENQRFNQTGLNQKNIFQQIIQISNALTYIHNSLNITHANLKPANIIQTKDGIYKICDFCPQKILNSKLLDGISQQYMSPEQIQVCRGEAVIITDKSDIYSIGLIFIEILGYKLTQSFLSHLSRGEFAKLFDLNDFVDWHNNCGVKHQQIFQILKNKFFATNPNERINSYQINYELLPFLPFSQTDLQNTLQDIYQQEKSLEFGNIQQQNRRLYCYLTKLFCEQEIPDQEQQTGNTLSNIANQYLQQGNLSESLIYSQQAIDIFNKFNPSGCENTIQQMQKVCQTYIQMKEYDKAVQVAEKQLGLAKSILQEPDKVIAFSLICVAQSYRFVNKSKEGLLYAEEAYKMLQKIHGDKPHEDYSQALDIIGLMHNGLKDFSKQLEYKEQSLQVLQNLYGQNINQSIQTVLKNIGFAHYNLKNYQQSISYYQRSLEMAKQLFGNFHPNLINILQEIIKVQQILGQTQESENTKIELKKIQDIQKKM